MNHKALRERIEETSHGVITAPDVEIPAKWEPDGADFFSPSLMEADLMRRVLAPAEFEKWFARLSARPGEGGAEEVADPGGRFPTAPIRSLCIWTASISAGHGAWQSRRGVAGQGDPARGELAQSARRHAEAALEHVASGDYAGEHWLASFAVYMLATPSGE